MHLCFGQAAKLQDKIGCENISKHHFSLVLRGGKAGMRYPGGRDVYFEELIQFHSFIKREGSLGGVVRV